MDFVANGLLALGAAPLMSEDERELDELSDSLHALYVNLGTLEGTFLRRANKAVNRVNQLQKPIVLDPVGAGASLLRTDCALKLLSKNCSVVRGNASEILALGAKCTSAKGVESTHTSKEALHAAENLQSSIDSTIVISGETDYILKGKTLYQVSFGHFLMQCVTGMGCLLSALIAAFCAVNKNTLNASLLATQYVGLCGQYAAQKAQSPASFKIAFLDALYECPIAFIEKQLTLKPIRL